MSKNSYVEICVSNFEQSIQWFENVLGFRVVAREEDEYAELRRGETDIQLASDSAPYWETERSRLLPPGQRGSGVEIVLVVDDVGAVYRQAQQAQADIVRELAEYPWHMRQFWVRHPDGYLIRPAQRILSVNTGTYLRQIDDAFRHDETGRIAEALADEEEKIVGSRPQAYGGFLLDLEKDRLDDEAYLQICRETGRMADAVNRLLALGRVAEAVKETEHVSDDTFLSLADLFIQHGQGSVAEQMVRERIQKTENMLALEWLKKYYQARNDYAATLKLAETMFRKQPLLTRYQEIRSLAEQLGSWETLRLELLDFLDKEHNTTLLIQIALDEGDIDRALALLKAEEKRNPGRSGMYSYSYGFGYQNMTLTVAKAAEDTRPREAIELYQKHAERLIAQKQRKYSQEASNYLVKVRALYEKLGENGEWESYITTLREKNRSLRALKGELANKGL